METKHRNLIERMPVEICILIAEKLSVRDLNMMGSIDRHMRIITMPLLRGCKLLQILTRQGEISSVDFLERTNYVDIRVQDAHGMTALHYAAMKGYKKVVKLLTMNSQYRGLLNAPEKRQNDTPLILAARYHDESVCQLLLDTGANVNSRNAHGETVLFWVVKRQRTNLARMLLKRGADPNQGVRHGLTLLTLAIMEGCFDLVKVLLEEGCDVEQPDAQGYRPLVWAVVLDDLAVANLLFAYNTDAATQSNGKKAERSPLVWAVMKGNVDMVQLLLKHGADIGQTPTDRRAPLIWAVIHRVTSVAEVLLQNGARPNEADLNGQTALVWAMLNRDKEMIQLLLEYGADPEVIGRKEWLVSFVPDVQRQ
ncbi:hypothetical protein N7471_010352 [Penicillium samsonianum]|uniref:uncharacterized protein n=1 Tax=Penicillium samsonianum TaxID=1882272 RepID=UPI00254993C9|nr:uncharacterized protein N7471_010352 [Penicillium samsonianum]KAJ6125859.1 hypothetical protein N7471_010352 [Penicillium samsonianum]